MLESLVIFGTYFCFRRYIIKILKINKIFIFLLLKFIFFYLNFLFYYKKIKIKIDIKKKMDLEKKKFDGVDSDFRANMLKFTENPNLWDGIENEKIK